MQSKNDQIAQKSLEPGALKWLKYLAITLFVLVAVGASVILIRGDSWSKMKARAAAKGQIDYYFKRQGPNGPNTLTARHSLVLLLIRQKFPSAARRENNRYLADLKRIPGHNIQNEKFRTAMEFREAGFLGIAIEELSAIAAENGNRDGGILASHWTIITLMEMKRYAEAETRCRQLLGSPEKLDRLRKHKEWYPWEFLAKSLASQGKHAEAEPAFKHAIGLSEEFRGTDYFGTQYLRVHLAHSLAAMGRNEEAFALAHRALAVLENFKYSSSEYLQELREFITRLDR